MKDIILYVATVTIWGTTFYAIKFQLGVVDPFVSVGYRFTIAGALLLGYCYITGRLKNRITIKQHSFIAILGLFQFCMAYCLTYLGTDYLTSGLVSLCFSTITIMNIVNQRLIYKIPFCKKVIIGTITGLTGMACIFSPEISSFDLSDSSSKGLILCLIAAYTASLGNMTSIKTTHMNISVTVFTAYGMFYGGIITLAFCFITGIEFSFSTNISYIASLLYLSICGSLIAFLCFLTLIKNIGADRASYSTILFPVIAMTISTLFEGYKWSPIAIVGVTLILLGNIIAISKTKAKTP